VKYAIKTVIEKTFRIKIYLTPPPRGTDLFSDLNKCYGINNFRTVFDVGANVGQSAISYASKFPSADIYSFEPVSSTFTALEENTQSIGSRLHLINSAVGKTVGNKGIYVNPCSLENSIAYKYRSSSQETVKIDTIDDFMKRNDIKIVDFLKIDTEGYELEVLAGSESALREQRIGVLYIEAEPTPSDKHFVSFEDIRLALGRFGYQLFGIYQQIPHFSGENSILFFNPVFICQRLADRGVAPDAYPLRR